MSAKDIAALLGLHERATPPEYRDARLPIRWLIILPQPRMSFDPAGILELAESIRGNGLMTPLTVYERRGVDELEEYLALVNKRWGTHYAVGDFWDKAVFRGGESYFYVVIAGERRYRAITTYLQDTAYYTAELSVRIPLGVSPLQAFSMQFSENIHDRPAPHEEAYALDNMFGLVRDIDPDFPLAAFARAVHRSPETIRNAVRFCHLPSFAQDAVKSGTIPYGIAIELSRLQDEGECSLAELDRWMTQAILSRKRVSDFRKDVSGFLSAKQNGQGALFEATPTEASRARRLVVAQEAIRQHWRMAHYFRRVLEMLIKGQLGREESPYSEGSPLRMLGAQVEQMELLVGHLDGLLPARKKGQARTALAEVRARVEYLLSRKGNGNDHPADNGLYPIPPPDL